MKRSPFDDLYKKLTELRGSRLSQSALDKISNDFLRVFSNANRTHFQSLKRLMTAKLTKAFRNFKKKDFEKFNKGIKGWRAYYVNEEFRKILKSRILLNIQSLSVNSQLLKNELARRLILHLTPEGLDNITRLKSELKPLTLLKKESKKTKMLITDQSRKMVADFNEVVAQKFQAFGFVWRNMEDKRVVGNPSGFYPKADKDSRIHGDHWSRMNKFYFYKDSWPLKKGFINRKSKDFYLAQFKDGMPGKPINCRCFAYNYYDLNDLYKDFPSLLSDKGREHLKL